jgi:hypothetical protein
LLLQARKETNFVTLSARLILFNRIGGGTKGRTRAHAGFNACDKSGAPVLLRTQCLLFFLLGDLNF